MQISLLKVFSHEIHQMFENDLAALGSLKQLKYFYNLPIGQVFEALSQLYQPNPNSNYWKATQTSIYDNDLSSKRVCDFLKVRIINREVVSSTGLGISFHALEMSCLLWIGSSQKKFWGNYLKTLIKLSKHGICHSLKCDSRSI